MTAETIARTDLRQVLLDALEEAFWARRAEVEGCRDCPKQPTGICTDHQADSDAAQDFEDARKQMEQSPDSPEVLAAMSGTNMAAFTGGTDLGGSND